MRDSRDQAQAPGRKPTNVSLDPLIVAEAKLLGINVSRACEAGLSRQIAQENGRRWQVENAPALEHANDFVARHGLPLAKLRLF